MSILLYIYYSFINGLLFLWRLLTDNIVYAIFSIIGIALFITIYILNNKDIDEEFVDDERSIV